MSAPSTRCRDYTVKHFIKGRCAGTDTYSAIGLKTVAEAAMRAIKSGHTERAEILDDQGILIAQILHP